MDQEELLDKLSDKILNKLPGEIVIKLAEISEKDGDHDAEVRQLFKDNNIDLEELAKKTIEEEK